jgi:uncharacterized protein
MTTELKFTATADKGRVTALLNLTTDAQAIIVFAHGAGADIRHQHMQSITRTLNDQGLATLRFNFPYMESGGKRTDSKQVCIETFSNAVRLAGSRANGLATFIGGHSFGGRMSSHYMAGAISKNKESGPCRGLVYYSFPLHPAKKPAITRADHLHTIGLPMLFLSGTRDTLAEPDLLNKVVGDIDGARLHWLDTADHGFKILKRGRQSTENVYTEAARVTAAFVREIA